MGCFKPLLKEIDENLSGILHYVLENVFRMEKICN
jgi:hypothetical protein